MTFLSWRSDYQVGNSQIDAEHQQLFKLINEFHDQCARGNARRHLLPVLNSLVAYAEEHFQHEEAMMLEARYPRLARQQAMHENLYSTIYALNEKLSQEDTEVDMEASKFLKNWLLDHILVEDMDFGDFLRRKNAGSEKSARRVSDKNEQKQPAVQTGSSTTE